MGPGHCPRKFSVPGTRVPDFSVPGTVPRDSRLKFEMSITKHQDIFQNTDILFWYIRGLAEENEIPDSENKSYIPDFENKSQIPDSALESEVPVILGLIADACLKIVSYDFY